MSGCSRHVVPQQCPSVDGVLSAAADDVRENRTAYADPAPTVAMIVMRTCSLMVNGPGLSCTPNMVQRGTTHAARRPSGYETSWATSCPMATLGYRKKKNWFMPGIIIAQIIPMIQVRMVDAGMSKSSVLATAERTSGYGESSSAIWVSS